jgi:excisionase family DNA binding protein
MTLETNLLTVPEAQQYLRIGEGTLYRIFNRNELPRVRVGGRVMVRREDLIRYVDSQVVKEAA